MPLSAGRAQKDENHSRKRHFSPLRTDSRQPVSKICWCVKTFGEMMNVPKRLEPTGFFSFAPACAGRFGWMRIGGSSKIARTAEGCVRRFTCLVPAWPAWDTKAQGWLRGEDLNLRPSGYEPEYARRGIANLGTSTL